MTKYLAYLPQSRRGLLVCGALALLLSGCSGLIGPSGPPPQIYVLAPDLHPLNDVPQVSWQLAVGTPDASESLDATRIALHRGAMMDYYADARWTDSVPALIQAKLVETFEKSGKIRAVAATSDAVRADYLLEATLRDFQANYSGTTGAPTIAVDIVVRIIKVGRSDIVATRDFHQESPAARNDIPSVVAAFNQASGAVLEEIAGWTLRTAGAEKADSIAPAAPPSRKHKIAS
jgi:cholesterol transport system auxiliary component